MRNTIVLVLDDAAADWYSYHFDDTLIQFDVHWRLWRDVINAHLTLQQLNGNTCAICGKGLLAAQPYTDEFVGGFHLRTCLAPCSFQPAIQKPPAKKEGPMVM